MASPAAFGFIVPDFGPGICLQVPEPPRTADLEAGTQPCICATCGIQVGVMHTSKPLPADFRCMDCDDLATVAQFFAWSGPRCEMHSFGPSWEGNVRFWVGASLHVLADVINRWVEPFYPFDV